MLFPETVPLVAPDIAELTADVYGYMLRTRPEKYQRLVEGVRRYKRWARIAEYGAPFGLRYFRDARTRIELIEAIYIALRLVDDIVDGDAPLPVGWDSAIEYVSHLIGFVRRPREPRDQVERLLGYSFALGEKLGMDALRRCDVDILGSLRFDAVRRSKPRLYIPRQRELDRHFYRLDIRGTIGACLIITRETRVTYRELEPLGRSTRIYYDLRDLAEDIAGGLCNISREDVREFGIRDVRDLASPRIQEWRLAKAEEGLLLLREYQQGKHRLKLHPFTHMVLNRAYEFPAEDFLYDVLEGT